MDIEAFGQRLKELRNNKSQTDIVKLIFEKTGVAITAQTLGRYENGKRKPDIEIIEALANTFNVSADYLLCRTDVKITDTDIKAMCEYTGLSEKSVECLHKLMNEDELLDNRGFFTDKMTKAEKSEILSAIISFGFLSPLVQSLHLIAKYSETAKSMLMLDSKKIYEIADILHLDIKDADKLVAENLIKMSKMSQEETLNALNNLRNIELIDVLRYNNVRLIEDINQNFDHRRDYLNYDDKELHELWKKAINEEIIDNK